MVDAVLLRNVVKAFGSFTAVDGIDLAIPAGEFFTLLGPSGCGKTTTLRLIAGFEQPTSGSVLIQGREMAGEPAHRRPVNTVFQSYALFPHLDVAANVGFSLSLQRVPAAERTRRVTEALRLVRMEAMAGRKPSELSGGQQQRVALARALVNRPSVLLLDEPLAALDLKLRKEMQMELKHMQRQLGITFILVTHDQEEALTLSDRIAIMKGGRVLQVDDPIGIYERPLTRFGADFIGETNFLVRPVAFREGARIGVSFAGEVVEMTAPPGFSGEEVTIALRPEALAIGTGAAGSFRLAGRLKEIIYIGTDRRVVVMLDSGEEVVARVQNSDTAAPLPTAPGTPIDLSCHPSALRALTD